MLVTFRMSFCFPLYRRTLPPPKKKDYGMCAISRNPVRIYMYIFIPDAIRPCVAEGSTGVGLVSTCPPVAGYEMVYFGRCHRVLLFAGPVADEILERERREGDHSLCKRCMFHRNYLPVPISSRSIYVNESGGGCLVWAFDWFEPVV